jgi:two-component SAPR family response regulator
VWLDDHLVTGLSATFVARAASLPRSASPDSRAAALELYTGHFAPEFEYEDWAMAWRDRLHAQFLALGELQVRNLWEAGKMQQAIGTAQRVLALDADAIAFEAALVALYAQTGADAAAAKQYEHYAARHREVAGTEPEQMAKVLALTPAGLRTVH